jgi:hypothetical protein
VKRTTFEFIRRARVERAYLVGVTLPGGSATSTHEHLEELAQLAQTAGAEVVGRTVQGRSRVDITTYIGEGKVQEIKQLCEEWAVNLVIFDDDLSPAQGKNLEKLLNVRVIDPSSNTRCRVSNDSGNTSNARPAVSARAVPVKPSSKWTAGKFTSAFRRSSASSRKSIHAAKRCAARAAIATWPR